MADSNLHCLRYADLQKIAKKLGIKANMKAESLIQAIKKFQQKEDGLNTTDKKIDSSDSVVNTKAEDDETINLVDSAKENEDEDEITPETAGGHRDRKPRKHKAVHSDEELMTSDESMLTSDSDTEVLIKTRNQKNIVRRILPGSSKTKKRHNSRTGIVDSVSNASEIKSDIDTKMEDSDISDHEVGEITEINVKDSSFSKVENTRKRKTPTIENEVYIPENKKSKTVQSQSSTTVYMSAPLEDSKLDKQQDKALAVKNKTTKTLTPLSMCSKNLKRSTVVDPTVIRRTPLSAKKPTVRTPLSQRRRLASSYNSPQEKLSVSRKSNQDGPNKERVVGKEVINSVTENHAIAIQTPSIKELVESMKGSDEEMKASLLAGLEKKVQSMKSHTIEKVSKLPRLEALLVKKRQNGKPVTPGNKNWKKIHQKHFSKMDSIDDYLEKKLKRTEAVTQSMKAARMMAESARVTAKRIMSFKTPPVSKVGPKILKPVVAVHGSMSSLAVGNQVKVNVKNNYRARKSLGNLNASTNIDSKTPLKSFTTPSGDKKPMNTSKVFNLKASLSKPVSWNAYTGKIQPLNSSTTTTTASRRLELVKKKPALKTRADRRQEQNMKRATKREGSMMRRRGIMA